MISIAHGFDDSGERRRTRAGVPPLAYCRSPESERTGQRIPCFGVRPRGKGHRLKCRAGLATEVRDIQT